MEENNVQKNSFKQCANRFILIAIVYLRLKTL